MPAGEQLWVVLAEAGLVSRQPPSNVQSRRELGRTPACLLPPGAAAHKEEEVIASWICFAAGYQSPPLQMVGYKQQQKN